ncbi:DUF1534 domain-containing protein [Pseudomonas syringae pv. dysoxyli]|nr:DUF1534 domain-containing protein [Pseudomonas syringae pv. dysoxyli]
MCGHALGDALRHSSASHCASAAGRRAIRTASPNQTPILPSVCTMLRKVPAMVGCSSSKRSTARFTPSARLLSCSWVACSS